MSDAAVEAWHVVCETSEIDEEDVYRFDLGQRTFAIYNTPKGFFATDGFCTHEEAHLADGMVIGTVIECPLHQGRFDIPTGKAKSAPVCVNLATYLVKVEDNTIYIQIAD